MTSRSIHLDFSAIEIIGGLLPSEVIAPIAAGEYSEQTNEGYDISKNLNIRDEIAHYYQIALGDWESYATSRHSNSSASVVFVWDLLRKCFGFETLSQASDKVIDDRRFPINFAAGNGRIPVIIAPSATAESGKPGIDELLPQFGDGHRRRSATQLLQEYLNADEDALWGIVCDGSTLRILRDNVSLTRPAWIEANLEKIFSEEGFFPDFSALWRILHASRFGLKATTPSDAPPQVQDSAPLQVNFAPSDCPLERWKERGRIDGAAAKDSLRLGVEAALIELGRGFLQHSDNTELREKFYSGDLKPHTYFEELLRVVYRLIFLFAAEDRDLLHEPKTTSSTRTVYQGGYSLNRLRERSTRNASLDRNIDAWEGMKSLFKALSEGQPALGLVALGGLFEPEKLLNLATSKIENKRFLRAIWRIAWFRPEGRTMTKVNWRDMETEELGSVYESLLELTPELNLETRDFTFAEGDATKGNARKVSGSYYTPDSLVRLLLDTTLDPVLDAAEARNPSDPVSEILKLSIIDPACGSGHFLLSAARRAADRITLHRTSSGAISNEDFQHALREVTSNCIYGVDRNPMAVELCKVALWIEALEPGKPLSFLDARIQCGDSLIGVFNYGMLKAGMPDGAYECMTGDDKEVAKAYRNLNKGERDGKGATGFVNDFAAPDEIVDDARHIAAMPEDTLRQVKAKARAFEKYEDSEQWQRLKFSCDLYVAAFFTPKTGVISNASTLADMPIPTTGTLWNSLKGNTLSSLLLESVTTVVEKTLALHWPLAFPAVMAQGGFDAVVGNPPWERIKLLEQEFFASRDEAIATAKTKAARNRLIEALATAEPGSVEYALYVEFREAKRSAEASSFFVRKSGRFPLSGVGDVNTYALFAEHFSRLARRAPQTHKPDHPPLLQATADIGGVREALSGRAGMIVPTGIATDISTNAFFADLVSNRHLKALYDFENREKLFPAVDSRMKFSILAIGLADTADFAFFLQNTKMLEEKERRFTLTPEQIAAINPNTKTVPVFRSRADAELTAKIYSKVPILIEERPNHPEGDKNPWGVKFQAMFHLSSDSHYFREAEELERANLNRSGAIWEHSDGCRYVPLYEAKMFHHYDHRWATFEGEGETQDAKYTTLEQKQDSDFELTPRYWLPEDEVDIRASRVPTRLKSAFKDEDEEKCLKILAEWVLGSVEGLNTQNPTASLAEIRHHLVDVLGPQAISTTVVGKSLPNWLIKIASRGAEMQFYTPLTQEDLAFIKDYGWRWLELAGDLIARKIPLWLIGWRAICRSTDERTVISSVFQKVGAGNTIFLLESNHLSAVQLAMMSSIPFDYIARQKHGGTAFLYYIMKQLPFLPPKSFDEEDIQLIQNYVLKLTYTSHSMRPWAEYLGYKGAPFTFNPDCRALIRAELDAFFAMKYGLTRNELRYMLDPHDVKGENYPSETFRGLKNKEMKEFGEYRTQRLVLEAFDRITKP